MLTKARREAARLAEKLYADGEPAGGLIENEKQLKNQDEISGGMGRAAGEDRLKWRR
jgi:hypothetical protein